MSRISRRDSDRRGIAAVEFALLLPVMLLLLLGTTDLALWMRDWLQVTQAASKIGDIIGQYTALHEADFTGTFYPVAQDIASGVSLQCGATAPGNIIISGITTANGKSTVTWQRRLGTCTASQFGVQGGAATLPDGYSGAYVPPNGVSIIAVEVQATQPAFVFSKGLPLMGGNGPSTIRSYAIVTTRNGQLPAVQP